MRFKVKTDGYPPQHHSFPNIRRVVIGRARDCEIFLSDIGVAMRHCRIEEQEDGGLRLFDHGSTNGTYVNGQRIDPRNVRTRSHLLDPKDEIRLGRGTVIRWWDPTEPEPAPDEEDLGEAASESTEAKRLWELSQKMWALARVVAKNPAAPPELLDWLGRGYDRPTWEALAQNPSTPVKSLLRVGDEFPKKLLENPVFSLLILEDPGLIAELPTYIFEEMFYRWRAEGRSLEMFLQHSNEFLREWARKQLSSSK